MPTGIRLADTQTNGRLRAHIVVRHVIFNLWIYVIYVHINGSQCTADFRVKRNLFNLDHFLVCNKATTTKKKLFGVLFRDICQPHVDRVCILSMGVKQLSSCAEKRDSGVHPSNSFARVTVCNWPASHANVAQFHIRILNVFKWPFIRYD